MKQGFWSIYGNQMSYWKPSGYIVIVISLLLITAIYFKRNNIVAFNKRASKNIGFKNIDRIYQIIGFIGIVYVILRTIWFIQVDYINKWELLNLHLCRLHLLLVFMFLAFKKKELNRFVAYIALAGGMIGVGFGSLYVSPEKLSESGSIYSLHGITRYDAGFDSAIYWDFTIPHLLVMVLPIYFWIASGKKLTTSNVNIVMTFYFIAAISLWIINFVTSRLPWSEWRMNNWYMGTDINNPFKNMLGKLSAWPQNLLTYPTIGFIIFITFHHIYLFNFGNSRGQILGFWKEELNNIKNIKNIIRL